jgi:catechol 2,3-dioxygenase-like lactoylglutathione lyase family enzyme
MEITRTIIVLDAADLDAASSFWAALLGGTVDAEDDWHTVRVGGEARLGLQLAPDHVPPTWPTEPGHPQQQIHLDLFVTDPAAARAHALSIGARLVQEADLTTKQGFEVYADPAGHPFCLCWG